MNRKNDGDWFALSSDYPRHRKTLKLIRLLECPAADVYPIRLMAWLRDQENVDGVFADDGEVEQVARWDGERGKLVAALREAGFFDGLTFHNWRNKGGAGVASMLAERVRWTERRPPRDLETPTKSAGGSTEPPRESAGVSAPNSNSDSNRDSKTKTENKNDSCAEPKEAAASGPHEDAVLEFPTAGKTRSWNLYPSKVQEYQSTFPGVDVVAECRRALQWLRDNPARKKTARGIPKFLGSWLGRAQDRGPTTRPPASPPPSRTDDLPVLRPPQADPVLDGVRDLLGEVPHA